MHLIVIQTWTETTMAFCPERNDYLYKHSEPVLNLLMAITYEILYDSAVRVPYNISSGISYAVETERINQGMR
jgi:hypothetical protein